ncbi:hypothetical protein EYF80_014616 [Liparis tanakae]|uniref:Uncharacterized protein n=1 Tax=Liparis tanakae TaxID=230148 RepID=A0A4Z2IAZ4_9TELE|nr:hypothetical protein EYF80_014616 [Liparis tanakae]
MAPASLHGDQESPFRSTSDLTPAELTCTSGLVAQRRTNMPLTRGRRCDPEHNPQKSVLKGAADS